MASGRHTLDSQASIDHSPGRLRRPAACDEADRALPQAASSRNAYSSAVLSTPILVKGSHAPSSLNPAVTESLRASRARSIRIWPSLARRALPLAAAMPFQALTTAEVNTAAAAASTKPLESAMPTRSAGMADESMPSAPAICAPAVRPSMPSTSTVLVNPPTAPAKPAAMTDALPRNSLYAPQAATPMSRRGRIDTRGLVNSGSSGPTGATAAFTRLVTPKTRPTAVPATGPSSTAAMMTGMCMMVSDVPPNQGRKPSGVSAMTTETAPRAPAVTMFLDRGTLHEQPPRAVPAPQGVASARCI